MLSKGRATEGRKMWEGEAPHQRPGLILFFLGMGLLCRSLAAEPVAAQEKPGIKKTVTVDIHCHISTPEVEPLVRDLLTPEKDPFFRFATPETQKSTRECA